MLHPWSVVTEITGAAVDGDFFDGILWLTLFRTQPSNGLGVFIQIQYLFLLDIKAKDIWVENTVVVNDWLSTANVDGFQAFEIRLGPVCVAF